MMNYKEFSKVRKEYGERLDQIADALFNLELGDTNCLTFYSVYEQFLDTKCKFLQVLFDFYKQMYDNSFFFMKPLVARRVRALCIEHRSTLKTLTLVRLYMNLLENNKKDEND